MCKEDTDCMQKKKMKNIVEYVYLGRQMALDKRKNLKKSRDEEVMGRLYLKKNAYSEKQENTSTTQVQAI